MAQTDVLTGRCPGCGEELEIPAHLKQFSCMYCGARLTPSELVNDAGTDETVDGEACAAYYRAHVLESITNHPGIEKEMTRSNFVPAFERFSRSNEEIFRQLDAAASAGAITLEDAADEFLNQLEARWDREASWKKSRGAVMDTDKFVIAVFLVPMIRRMGLKNGEDYCKILQAHWCSRHPKSPFYLGDYEELAGGFRKKFLGLCFITTAVCLREGKPDDCAELTAFRTFRDGYLRACPDGPALIDEYYDVAPGIVLRIDLSHDREARYDAIRETWLEPCYADLRAGNLSRCKERYVEMVRSLEKEYLS